MVAQNKNFSVISKYHISINVLAQRNPCIFHPRKNQSKGSLAISKRYFGLKKISFLFVFLRAEIKLSHFLKRASFVKTKEKIIFPPTSLVEKDLLLPPEIRNINFSFIPKFINPSFLLNMNFTFVQRSCLYDIFFLSFIETCFF